MSFERVSEKELRALFSSYRIQERLTSGELSPFIESERPADARYGQPPGTLSQTIAYWDVANRTKVALVHQFLCPDGTIGASGMPDPKRLELDGTVYVLKPKRQRRS